MNTRNHSISITAIARLRDLLTVVVLDRVLITILLILFLVAVIDPGQSRANLLFALESFAGILPFLLLAVLLAALSRATGADNLIAGAFTGNPGRTVVLAALAGALSPFCSCGVVPVIAALLRARVPLAPVMAFWIASPIMDPEMFVLTAAGIGVDFAVAKTAITIVMGLLAGYTIVLLQHRTDFVSPLRESDTGTGCAAALPGERIEWRFWRSADRRRTFQMELSGTSLFLGKWLLLAFLLEGLMLTYLPPEWIGQYLGDDSWYEIPLAALVGVPAYLNGYAAIPLVAGLMELGMDPGAAMAFMTAGAVSSVPAAVAVAVLVKRRVFATYLALGLGGALLTGLLYGAIE